MGCPLLAQNIQALTNGMAMVARTRGGEAQWSAAAHAPPATPTASIIMECSQSQDGHAMRMLSSAAACSHHRAIFGRVAHAYVFLVASGGDKNAGMVCVWEARKE